MSSKGDANSKTQNKMTSEYGLRSVNQLLPGNFRPFTSKRVLLTITSLVILSLFFHHALYIRDSLTADVSRFCICPAPDFTDDAHQISPSQVVFQPLVNDHDSSVKSGALLDLGLEADYQEKGSFQTLRVHGYDNGAIPGGQYVGHNLSCSSITHSADIGVQKSFFLYENLMEVAAEMDSHPMIDYAPTVAKFKTPSYELSTLVDASWDRLATSCLWMPDYGVHMCVSRIIFHPGGKKDRCRISFLRGQIYSANWVHLDKYRLNWKGQEIVFPKTFDTDTDYEIGKTLYGPEDARIILEEGVEHAEPVIVFNMISRQSGWRRAMFIFRPFSQQTTILTVRDMERPKKEKNWAPFFVRDLSETANSTSPRQPSEYIHFVWKFEPMAILKCHLYTGMCDIVFDQVVLPSLQSFRGDHDASLRGGTQFVPIPLSPKQASSFGSPNVQAFAAFPRTHIELPNGCKQAVYRPELTVLVTNTTHFYLTYGSQALDFGDGIVIETSGLQDICNRGRIMITNSIARWDLNSRDSRGAQTDIMTLTLSVDDATVQVMRVSGVWNLLRTLPSLAGYFEQHMVESGEGFPTLKEAGKHWEAHDVGSIDRFERANAVGWDVRACLEESALEYVDMHLQERRAAEAERNATGKATQSTDANYYVQPTAQDQEKKVPEGDKKKAEDDRKKAEDDKKKAEEDKKKKAEDDKKKAEDDKKKPDPPKAKEDDNTKDEGKKDNEPKTKPTELKAELRKEPGEKQR